MNPLVLSAKHAAYTWYLNKNESGRKDFENARRFAQAQWDAFLPVADAGWGRLLRRIAKGRGGFNKASSTLA